MSEQDRIIREDVAAGVRLLLSHGRRYILQEVLLDGRTRNVGKPFSNLGAALGAYNRARGRR